MIYSKLELGSTVTSLFTVYSSGSKNFLYQVPPPKILGCPGTTTLTLNKEQHVRFMYISDINKQLAFPDVSLNGPVVHDSAAVDQWLDQLSSKGVIGLIPGSIQFYVKDTEPLTA